MRNKEGKLIECLGKSFHAASVSMVREACFFCLKAGISNVVIERDNLDVLNFCSDLNRAPPWDCKAVLSDIKEYVI